MASPEKTRDLSEIVNTNWDWGISEVFPLAKQPGDLQRAIEGLEYGRTDIVLEYYPHIAHTENPEARAAGNLVLAIAEWQEAGRRLEGGDSILKYLAAAREAVAENEWELVFVDAVEARLRDELEPV